MTRLLRFIWKTFVVASVFGIGYIIGREHAFEEDEEWDDDDIGGDNKESGTEPTPAPATENAATAPATEPTPAPAAQDDKPAPAAELREVSFAYTDEKATAVAVVGDFNDWNKDKHPMTLTDGTWNCTLQLAPGRHEYKFVVNNTDWVIDPKSTETVPDKYGSQSSLLVLQ